LVAQFGGTRQRCWLLAELCETPHEKRKFKSRHDGTSGTKKLKLTRKKRLFNASEANSERQKTESSVLAKPRGGQDWSDLILSMRQALTGYDLAIIMLGYWASSYGSVRLKREKRDHD